MITTASIAIAGHRCQRCKSRGRCGGDLPWNVFQGHVPVAADRVRNRAGESHRPNAARAKSLADPQTALPEQAALADFIAEGHLERHIRRMRRVYGSRRQALVESLDQHFGDRVEIVGDAAGMHLLVRFQDERIAQKAPAEKIQLVSSAGSYLSEPRAGEFILGFSAMSERLIRDGIRRLAMAER